MRVPSAGETTVGSNKRIEFKWPESRPHEAAIDRAPRLALVAINYATTIVADGWRQPVDLILCAEVRFGCRFLSVTNRPIVSKVWDDEAFVELRAGSDLNQTRKAAIQGVVLIGRNLRFADLHGSELFAADMTGADLTGANLNGAKLQQAFFGGGARLQGVALVKAQLQGAILWDAQLQGAFLMEAQLQDANLLNAQLQGANLTEAQLQGVFMPNVKMQGATLWEAKLQGATLHFAHLEGADLLEAQLQGADLWHAYLQGAALNQTQLQGANLQNAQLQGANLRHAKLHGATLIGAQLQGADINAANLWNLIADPSTDISLADLRNITLDAITLEQADSLLQSVPELRRARLSESLKQRPGADQIPMMSTSVGPALVSRQIAHDWKHGSPGQLTDAPATIAPALADYLADQVAPLSEAIARRIASRVPNGCGDDALSDALRGPLASGLLARASTGGITLEPEIAARLMKSTAPCPPAEPDPTPKPLPPVSQAMDAPSSFLALPWSTWDWLWGRIQPTPPAP